MAIRVAMRPTAARTRRCQYADCSNTAITAHIFCAKHATCSEGVEFHHEMQMAAAYLAAQDEAPTEDEVVRRERQDRFARRVKRGDFGKLLDAATSKVLQQAATDRTYQLELGALRFAIARTISEEEDAHRMSLAIAEYETRDPKPVVRYGTEWEPPLPGGEKLVHYIWRHRPADFEERYMAQIDEPDSLPETIDQQVQTDYRHSRQPGQVNTDAEGKYLPPPMPEWRKSRSRAVEESRSRTGGADGDLPVPADIVEEDDSHIDYDLDDDRPWLADAWAAQTEASTRLARGT
jgi:hypothetical protein